MSEATSLALAEALDEAGFLELGARARRDEFHDFRSPHTLPAMELVKELAKHGSRGRAFAERVKAGEFDASKEESEAWARSPDGQATMREFGVT